MGQVNGVIWLAQVEEESLSEPVTRFLAKPPIILDAQMNVLEAFALLKDFVGVSVPVVTDKRSYHFAGVVYQRTVMRTYLRAVAKSQQDER